jgi:hypothetical protein
LAGLPPTSVGGEMWNGSKVVRWIEQRNALEKVHAQRGREYLTARCSVDDLSGIMEA